MRLYLIRHGKAARDSDSGRDEDRRLAPRGKRQAEWLGETLAAGELPPVRVVASPAARAARTAALIADVLGLEVETSDEVGLSSRASWVVGLIAEAADTVSLAIVGHNPTLSMVAETLVHGVGGGGGGVGQIELRTGEAAVLDLPDPTDPIGSATLVRLLRLDD
ncbi:MAG: histidine phosphatase family protein [Planctomycetota bacterium]|nr:histidine phosphatase family protein [Planctomycetota bacterium]